MIRPATAVDLFRAVFEDAADAMLVVDDRRTVVEANTAASMLFNAAGSGLVSRPLDVLVEDDPERLDAAWRELMALGEATCEHTIRIDGVKRHIECCYRARVQPDRHLCVARDITERRLLEHRVMQAEKIESIGRLAGGIAHDFNNLLTAILGYADLLLRERAPTDPDRRDIEEIQKAGQRAAALTQQLLAFSRKQVLLPKDVDLNQTVSSLQAMLARLIREDITISCELWPAPAVVRIDPTQIEQVILNLVLNARDALPSGGCIRLEVACVGGAQAELAPDQRATASGYVRLRVRDDGVGIPPEVRPHVFEPFFTTKPMGKGTGLGLASVYGIVRQSNGFISVESEPGIGTTFTMHFPAVDGVSATEGAPGAASSAPATRDAILLVEDEDAVRAIVATVLRRRGYAVLEATSPSGAVDLFDRHAAEIGLLLTDVVLPEMNGPALAQRLIDRRPELRVLFMSGYADLKTSLDADNPNVSFLSKPFQASVLVNKVHEILNRSRPREQV